MSDNPGTDTGVERFIAKWRTTEGGAERANYQLFLTGFCHALGLDEPGHGTRGVLSDYQFEGPVERGSAAGNKGFIDLYKKGRFVLEAKQSLIPQEKRDRPELFDVAEAAPAAPSGAKYDALMRGALNQARNYAVNLPADHPWPPFLIVCDVGRAFELYFDWSGNGRGYAFYPDKQHYRITIDQLADPAIQELFRAIWTNPSSIDPRARAAEVTRDVAKRLADVSKWLEAAQKQKTVEATSAERSLAIEESALFLMRLLFCMFAEDVGLLPKDRFKAFLEEALEDDRHFQKGLADLWASMGDPHRDTRWSWALKDEVRYFNGGLFASTKTYALGRADRGELLAAARADWKRVEPAIFGTLLEQALTTSERAKLGAHYTPRPYVERLVQATIMDVLEGEWGEVQAEVAKAKEAGETAKALTVATAFLNRINALRILDPACGTGNFLYVAMELLMRLESEIIELIASLGGRATPGVGPEQFLGLELNPRAAVIAELVLWIGWLRWRTANDPQAVPEPVLRRTDAINFGGHAGYDAVLGRAATGEPDVETPKMPGWPEADFIIGNPPFIGKGAAMRSALGSDYVEALWKAHPGVPKSADFVMFWWDRAATLLTSPSSRLRRFGFVTTNSIAGGFNRRVLDRHRDKLSLVFAVADHPWTKATPDAAAVRISMTAAEAGQVAGELLCVRKEQALRTDEPVIELRSEVGFINTDLTVGADVTSAKPLLANKGLASNGVLLAGQGFKLTKEEADYLISMSAEGASDVIRPYIGGGELVQQRNLGYVIDLFGFDERRARTEFPALYDRLLRLVKPQRADNRKTYRREKWWEFGENNPLMRQSLSGINQYIGTTETAKHRLFQFLDSAIVPDHMIIAIALADGFSLGVLSSRIHTEWALRAGGTLEDRPRYNKAYCFDVFPFPDATPQQCASIAELANELDAARKAALRETPGLTLTEIYNLRDMVRSGEPLIFAVEDRATRARAGIVNRLHEQIDEAVAAAYGWPANLPPSEIVTRLVALNTERAAEERGGTVRWLRPDYQEARFGTAEARP